MNAILQFLSFLMLFATEVSPEYTRPKTRPLIFRQHNGSDSDPQQVHVSLAGKDRVRITWITSDKNVQSVVDYGKSPGNYDATASGEILSYRYFFYTSGAIHHVKIGPLDPSTVYYYRCGKYGEEFSFRTPPAAFPVEFAVAGDLGQTKWTESTLSHIGGLDYDVFILPDDLSYADMDQTLWDSFGRLVEPYARARPWMATEGNHEIESIPIIYPHGFRDYNSRWLMPYQESGSGSNLYYSFDVAGAHIVMVGSYADFGSDSDQYKWLNTDLASVDRGKTPWLFVVLHAPWYNSNFAHRGEGEKMRKSMEGLLYNARVDALFAGHVHAYERFTRVYDNEADECGIVHITIGDGGNREGLASSYMSPTPSISIFREASFGHGRLRIINDTFAHWSWHRNDDTVSVVADEVWIRSLRSSQVCFERNEATSKHKNDEL